MGDAVTAKALSDRFTSFAVIEAYKKMYTEKINTDYDIYAVFSSKSRVGYSNAASVAEKIKPDVVLSLTAEEICGGDDERASVFLPYKGTRLVYDRTFLRNLSDTAYRDTCRQDTFCENRIGYTSGKSEKILERNTEADFGSESYNADDSNRKIPKSFYAQYRRQTGETRIYFYKESAEGHEFAVLRRRATHRIPARQL